MKSATRRSFLKSAGVAAGVAAVSASPALSATVEPDAVEMIPTAPIGREPVIAIVRDARLGEVTVLSGTTEKTYKDRMLASRLVKAAARNGAGEVA